VGWNACASIEEEYREVLKRFPDIIGSLVKVFALASLAKSRKAESVDLSEVYSAIRVRQIVFTGSVITGLLVLSAGYFLTKYFTAVLFPILSICCIILYRWIKTWKDWCEIVGELQDLKRIWSKLDIRGKAGIRSLIELDLVSKGYLLRESSSADIRWRPFCSREFKSQYRGLMTKLCNIMETTNQDNDGKETSHQDSVALLKCWHKKGNLIFQRFLSRQCSRSIQDLKSFQRIWLPWSISHFSIQRKNRITLVKDHTQKVLDALVVPKPRNSSKVKRTVVTKKRPMKPFKVISTQCLSILARIRLREEREYGKHSLSGHCDEKGREKESFNEMSSSDDDRDIIYIQGMLDAAIQTIKRLQPTEDADSKPIAVGNDIKLVSGNPGPFAPDPSIDLKEALLRHVQEKKTTVEVGVIEGIGDGSSSEDEDEEKNTKKQNAGKRRSVKNESQRRFTEDDDDGLMTTLELLSELKSVLRNRDVENDTVEPKGLSSLVLEPDNNSNCDNILKRTTSVDV